MATTKLTPDLDAIIGEVFIAAPPARVFQAITDPEQVPRWWGQQGNVPNHGVERRRATGREVVECRYRVGRQVISRRGRIPGSRSAAPSFAYLDQELGRNA